MKRGSNSKPHIGIFGRRNTGKSTFINCLIGQDLAIVSDIPGTTTDPVKKSIEIFGIGPSIVIDTAGIDDVGVIGKKRILKSKEILKIIDLAILMISNNQFADHEQELINDFKHWNIPFIIIHNKSDLEKLQSNTSIRIKKNNNADILTFNGRKDSELEPIIASLKKNMPVSVYNKKSLLAGILSKNDHVLLVTPIDKEAPEGRLILPQVMAIRDIIDNECICIVLRENQLEYYLQTCSVMPKIVITDSQAFELVKNMVPKDIMLTGFSVLFAHYKGEFEAYLEGTSFIDKLKNGDHVLLLESCTHQVNCDDIGRYKIPKWIGDYTGKDINFEVVSGLDKVSRNINDFSLVIQCGGCMVTKKQVKNRLKPAIDHGIPVTNYGMAIAWVNGIFDRATDPFRVKDNAK